MKIIPKTYIFLFIWSTIPIYAQSLSGHLTAHPFQEMTLEGFENFTTLELVKTQADSLGNFSLTYPKDYSGMALLKTQDNNSTVVLLSGADIRLQGTHITETDSLLLNAGPNKDFFTYALAHSRRRNALNAWKYLDRLYDKNTRFSKQKKIKKAIACR